MNKEYSKYAPFCHGTNSKSAKIIDKYGMKTAIEAERKSQHIGSHSSKMDRVYFGTMRSRNGIQKCIEAAEYASRGNEEDDMILYILDKIPEECVPIVDEDVNLGFVKKTTDPLKSLEYISSFGISKCNISPKHLKKLNPKEFHKLATETYPDIMNWESFKKYFID